MKFLWHISRILLGITFTFSGFVKGIDPLGSAYKFTDYFNAWGLESLTPLAFAFGILLSATEFITGITLLFNVFVSFFSWIAMAFMLFFSSVTLIIAIQNPVTDCGCFGDALALSNWQTFYKNILFSLLAIILFIYRNRFKLHKEYLVSSILAIATVFVFAYLIDYSYNHLPIIDFRPYKVGVNILEGMKIPEGAEKDVYKNTFHYKNKNTGKTKKFNQDNYPWQDTINWEFVSMDEPVLVKKGYEPPIQNFVMETHDGEDVRDFFLYDEGYTIILIAYDLAKAETSENERIASLINFADNNVINFIGLTSSSFDEANEYLEQHRFNFEFFNCDEITLKTIIRSNPGFVVICNGTIVDKWHLNDIPDEKEMKNRMLFYSKILQ